jgi:hypothetical protein
MELLRIAEHDNVDMIVIATHGTTGWSRIAFGPVARKVVEPAGCPALILRAKVADHSSESHAHSSSSSATAVDDFEGVERWTPLLLVSLANCYFPRNSSAFPSCYDSAMPQSGRSFHPVLPRNRCKAVNLTQCHNVTGLPRVLHFTRILDFGQGQGYSVARVFKR